ncbi:MAG: hypothetical protein KIT27_09670 [Legionellales bacterium]|nr:hypothetical protein [Legionellales bacterium]
MADITNDGKMSTTRKPTNPEFRFEIIQYNCLPEHDVMIKLFDFEKLEDVTTNVISLYQNDEILTNLSANNLRAIMSLWVDNSLLKERDIFKNNLH